ncbi:hypothetical protein ScPMuIL_002667 [Solemya velum]
MVVLVVILTICLVPMALMAPECHLEIASELVCSEIPTEEQLVSMNISNIKELDLSGIDITNVTCLNYSSASQLAKIDLSRNRIKTISQHAFVTRIRAVDLSHNQLSPGSFAEETVISSFKHIEWFSSKHLDFIDLSHNFLTTIGPYSNNKPHPFPEDIDTINLSHNKIDLLPELSFFDCIALRDLDLSHNQLTTVTKLSLPWSKVDVLKLDGNPWKCDCSMKWMKNETEFDMSKHTVAIICDSPHDLAGQNLLQIDEKRLCELRSGSKAVVIGSVAAILVAAILIGLVGIMKRKGFGLSRLLRGQAAYRVLYNEDPEEPVTKIYLADDKGGELLREAENV